MKFTESESNPMAERNKPIQAVTIGKMTISQFGDGYLWMEEQNGEHGGSFKESDIAKLLEEYHAKNF
ncbi:hypothetical protein [Proteus terrae]|uniref:hypothetical protein n=1 Tax=Proteus terrae TaxID=1574161 RepID=UPI0018E7C3C3|nr:hypothetical protein [Proteus terrae]MBJ2108279.1 hypothetical protein [Proteus terrae]MBJ2132151.1 hypothetical protein [Proteus terrae]